MTRAIRIYETGGPQVMRLEELEPELPGPGEALVFQRAIGVNYVDVQQRRGAYPLHGLPSGLGVEAAGVVDAIGPGVHQVKVGDRVAYAGGPPGAYADARLLLADRLVKLPEEIDSVTAAGMLLKGITAEYLLRRTYRVQAGQTVLFHAAAGGVGLIACQWLRHLGATVIGTVGSEAKAELARSHGCHYPIVYTCEDFVQRVRELTHGEGVDVVYDGVGRTTFGGSLRCLQPRGLLVSFGNAAGKPELFDPSLLGEKGSLYLTRPTFSDYVATRDELLLSAAELFHLVGQGAIRIQVRQRWPLGEAAEAHRALEERRTAGSTVLVP